MRKIFSIAASMMISGLPLQAQDVTEIIRKAEQKMLGETSMGSMTMKIIRPTWERTISFKMWTRGNDYSLILITSPPREKGQTYLKRGNEMWNWNPTISRMIKLPPSMMSQGWMGSDYTNDDILKESSIVEDYRHHLMGEETVSEYSCYKIELVPKEEAAVVWGRVIKWISTDLYMQMKSEYYDEEDFLIKTEIAYDVKTMDDRKIPTRIEIIPEDKKGQKTVFMIDDIRFNDPIRDGFFSQQNMKRVR